MSYYQLQALSNDLLAMEAVVRALVRIQAKRSPTALGDLLEAMTEQQVRMVEALTMCGDNPDHPAVAVLEAFIEHVKEEALAA